MGATGSLGCFDQDCISALREVEVKSIHFYIPAEGSTM